MSPSRTDGQELPLHDCAVRPYALPRPAPSAHLSPVRPHLSEDDVHGRLVGVSDGLRWGWWGPVSGQIADVVPGLVRAAFPDRPVAVRPDAVARQMCAATRHAHTGVLAVAAGAVELAVWDLAGQRAGAPVWALLGAADPGPPVPAYATCFGVDPDAAVPVAGAVGRTYPVQKWNHRIVGPQRPNVAAAVADRLGGRRLAVDFHGTWEPQRVRTSCAGFADRLAWVEEPYRPDEVHTGCRGEFGAPHAAGEHCYGPADTTALEAGGVDIWQPDAVFCGGMVRFLAVLRRAAQRGFRCLPHGGGLLPALHAVAAGELVESVENHLLLEPRRLAHLSEPPSVGGAQDVIAVPTAPGWGGALRKELVDA